jgi:DNA-directed RNA polymerase subunit M/transcription elongation factor TFIIS
MQMDFNLKKNSKLRADILSASEDALNAATLVRFSAEVRNGRPGCWKPRAHTTRNPMRHSRVPVRVFPSEHWPRPDAFGHERVRVRVRWQELATDEKRQEREAIEKKMKRECQRGTEAGQATTDQFKCGRCGQRKVSPEAQSMNNAACNHVLPPRRLRSTRTSRHGTRRESATWPTCDCMQHAAYDTQHAPHDMRHCNTNGRFGQRKVCCVAAGVSACPFNAPHTSHASSAHSVSSDRSLQTKYRQMQTRSADEPMTTFVSCVVCGVRSACNRCPRAWCTCLCCTTYALTAR